MPASKNASTAKARTAGPRSRTALAQIDRQFGKGSVMRLGTRPHRPVEVIPTGSVALDAALGIGGLPPRSDRRGVRTGVLR
jgi:recombination protein RecA